MQGAKRSITSRVTIKNPRPRKYASAAEKQAAFRARFPTTCVRVEPKTAETVQAIADASGRTQQETLLSMLKYAMTNRNWLTLGLTEHKQLPRIEEPRKENPMKRKPTPAQIAARERFAAMARSGAFKRKARKVKSNPISYGLDGVVNITDTYERSVASSRNLAEHYANQLRMRGREDIVYVVFGITPQAKAQAGRLRNGVTITLDPRDYEIAYAFHPTQGEISRQLKAQRDAERRAYTRQGMKLKSNPIERYELRRLDKRNDLDSTYKTLSHAKSALDEIDRPPASFYVLDTETGKHYFSFQAETKYPHIEIRGSVMQQAYKRNPRASNPQARSVKHTGARNIAYAVQAKRMLAGGGAQFETVAGFPTKAQAQDYIDALLKTYPKGLTLRISAA